MRFATVFSIALCLLWPVCFINTEIVRVPRNSLVICFLCVAVMSEQNVQPQLRRLMKLFAVALACAGFWYWQVFGRSAERVLYPVMEENLVFGSPFWMCVLALTEFTVAAFAIGSACGHNTMYAYYRQMKGSAPK